MFSETCSIMGGTDMSPAILYRVNAKRLVAGMLLILVDGIDWTICLHHDIQESGEQR